ncbi:RING-H2 zinc finger protein (macronuclear) [Tetrahymena thermophila SB210]|uniref:RING-H2 zinc finger protein n=1 Tax=Tetrahymena thermophila (strain SB210) TaxID=312017 RepID=Q24HY7_TETTS|nr:RING-H2 zinc finger protein [Tetrahymena thermophila SB210]EAS07451.3 RING-H2 zinc finger protein [Tetrahymena thermophila SB210]|eukprot:XP_001027693.3 RING-H2 zinc finger protein [Tetrahymena thermophila SB210]
METLIESFNQNQYSSSEIFFHHNYTQVNQQNIINTNTTATSQNVEQNLKPDNERENKKQEYEILLQQRQEEMVRQYLEEIRVLERQLWDMQNRQIFKQKNGVSENIFDKITTMRIGNTSQTCSICYNGFEKNEIIKKLPCKHIFHLSCIKPWLKKQKTCPNCRDDICESLKQQQEKKKQKQQNKSKIDNDEGEKLQKKETDSQRVQKSYDTPINSSTEKESEKKGNKLSNFTITTCQLADQTN